MDYLVGRPYSPDKVPDHFGVRTLTSATVTSGFCGPYGVDSDRSTSCPSSLLDPSAAKARKALWRLKNHNNSFVSAYYIGRGSVGNNNKLVKIELRSPEYRNNTVYSRQP